MIAWTFALLVFALAAFPAAMFFANLQLFRRAPQPDHASRPGVSVLIPARDEEASIGACVESVLANVDIDLEVVVLDDHSTDRTAEIVRAISDRDARARVEPAPPLPAGWCGKQHACHHLASLARHDLLLFIDADVRLSRDAIGRAVAFLRAGDTALVSGFPRQVTGSMFEAMLLPLIHFILLGFLPLARMRASPLPAYGAGCGQFFLIRRGAYIAVDGHAAVRASLHDGIMLPRAFRRHGFTTDIFDATDTASCRMYHGAAQTWRGLAKNATEGMAAPAAILPWTIVLLSGQVLPWVMLIAGGARIAHAWPLWSVLCIAAIVLSYAVRMAAAVRYGQPWAGALLHPIGIALLVALQWYALGRQLAGRPSSWRGRSYAATSHA